MNIQGFRSYAWYADVIALVLSKATKLTMCAESDEKMTSGIHLVGYWFVSVRFSSLKVAETIGIGWSTTIAPNHERRSLEKKTQRKPSSESGGNFLLEWQKANLYPLTIKNAKSSILGSLFRTWILRSYVDSIQVLWRNALLEISAVG